MRSRSVFDTVGSLNPGRSAFDLSYSKKFTGDMGQLYPIMCDEVVPGDVWKIGNEVVVRFQPLLAPIMHRINAFVHYFFVPYRLLWADWEDFITGGRLGDNASVLPRLSGTINIGSVSDYLGFPTGVTFSGLDAPMQFPVNAYNFIFNEYYRDQNILADVSLTNTSVLTRAWAKDYFTSALPWQQRGTSPAIPMGTTSAVWADSSFQATAPVASGVAGWSDSASTPKLYVGSSDVDYLANAKAFFAANTVNLSGASFNVSDLRLAFQIQKWMERNARAGARYTEFLKAHYGVAPRDERLQRPEYIGGSRSPVIISEVLQTGSTDDESPQGNMAGHGITVDRNFVASYHAKEFGLIMGILSVMPEADYSQGVNRQWLRRSRFDFYSPEFADLSEQAIEREELYATDVLADNRTIFGYQGRYDEMRTKPNQIAGLMRTDFDHWHLGRQFASAPALNTTFISCIPRKDVFAAPEEPGLIVTVGNKIQAIRPIPAQAEPGLIDHN